MIKSKPPRAMQTRASFKEPFNPLTQEEIYFTMKVYATKSGGKIKTLKYSIDLHPPFDANTNTIEPYASPLVDENIGVFNKIFDHVKDLMKYISNPSKYNHRNEKFPASKGWRGSEQRDLEEAIRLSKGAINHITYQQNSPPEITVGAVFRTTGNGDMRPPSTT